MKLSVLYSSGCTAVQVNVKIAASWPINVILAATKWLVNVKVAAAGGSLVKVTAARSW